MRHEGLRMKNGESTRTGHPQSKGLVFSIGNRQSAIGNALRLLLSALREIFDENAYSRFLQLRQLEPSRASYAEFQRENSLRRERRPRCC